MVLVESRSKGLLRKKKMMLRYRIIFLSIILLLLVFTMNACGPGPVEPLLLVRGCNKTEEQEDYPEVHREDKLPADIAKRGPKTDHHPTILHSNEYQLPVPLPYPINTAGAEDCPVITPDGKMIYFFFTPDVRVPPEKQLLDSVTGTYVSHKSAEGWSTPQRVWLQDPGKLSLDSTLCVKDDEMWFCSDREGYEGMNMFTAELIDGQWTNWEYVGDRLMKEIQIGEVYLHEDNLFFHSDRPGGKGGLDLWVTTREGDGWADPVNIEAVNTTVDEGFPFISTDGTELWFTRTYMGTPAIFRSLKVNGAWGEPEMILSQFAGGATLDDAGNIYFAHHYFENGEMIEADIYVAYKKDNKR